MQRLVVCLESENTNKQSDTNSRKSQNCWTTSVLLERHSANKIQGLEVTVA